jgi:tRNA-splicing ligase RtcB
MEIINKRLVNWASILDDKAREQALATSTMPFIFPHLALMSDAHPGLGATVGSVIPTLGAIMPAAVGVDIGCGMMAMLTQFSIDGIRERPDTLKVVHQRISEMVPLSAGNYNSQVWHQDTKRIIELEETKGIESAEKIAPNWRLQLGSLGSGNHFIEITVDELGRVWLFLHSGSRGVGNKLAQKHIKIAREQCERRWINLPDPDLAYLVEGDREFTDYITDLRWAQKFARFNRESMMDRVATAFGEYMMETVNPIRIIQCHHNYTECPESGLAEKWKHPRGSHGNIWLSRKGAIDASAGKPGLVPGSMGTASYVVTGLGNPMSLNSSPHGAGRNFSRAIARKSISRAQLNHAMEGIVWGESDEFLDEAPAAYKDIDTVMSDARDLVKIEHTLHQILNVKGN